MTHRSTHSPISALSAHIITPYLNRLARPIRNQPGKFTKPINVVPLSLTLLTIYIPKYTQTHSLSHFNSFDKIPLLDSSREVFIAQAKRSRQSPNKKRSLIFRRALMAFARKFPTEACALVRTRIYRIHRY